MLRLYDFLPSGNCYEVRLLLKQLGVAFERVEVLRWRFFERYSHEPYIATVRFWIAELGRAEAYREEIDKRRPAGEAAPAVMERRRRKCDFLVGDGYSIADIALYAYTHVAPEGGYDLGTPPA